MNTRIIDCIDFAVRTNAELARMGVPEPTITSERRRRTGHPRRLAPAWASTIGHWGGIRSLREVAEEIDVPVACAHSWMRFRGLRTRTRGYVRTQAQLAIAALATPGPASEVGPRLGILPVECCLYRSAAQAMRDELGVGLLEMLRWSPDALERAWTDLDFVVENQPELFSLDNPDHLDEVVREARWSADELDELVWLAERELPLVYMDESQAEVAP